MVNVIAVPIIIMSLGGGAECPLGALVESLNASLARLPVKEVPLAKRESTEGGSWNVYTTRSGGVRAIVRKDYGETGRREVTFVSVNRGVFAIRELAVEYEAPLSAEAGANTRKETVRDYFFCGDVMYVPVHKGRLEDAHAAAVRAEGLADLFFVAAEIRQFLPLRR